MTNRRPVDLWQRHDEGEINISIVMQLKTAFGNSITTTLRRVVENLGRAAFGLTSNYLQSVPDPGKALSGTPNSI